MPKTFANISIKLINVLVLLMLVLFPYMNRVVYYLLAIIYITWIFDLIVRQESIKSFLKNGYSILLLPIFCLILILNNLFVEHSMDGFKILERQISLFLLPFFFISLDKKQFLKKRQIQIALGIALMLFISLSILKLNAEKGLLMVFNKSDNFLHFSLLTTYYGLPYFLHRSYISFQILFYLVFILHSRFNTRWEKIFHISIGCISFVYMVILMSRSALLTIFILLLYLIIKLFYLKKRIMAISLLAITILVSIGLYTQTRLGLTFEKIFISTNEEKPKDNRIIIWQNALTIIKEKPVFGYGVGDATHELVKQYQITNFEEGISKKFNAHNQFLETWLQTGIPGLALLLAVFFIPIYQSINKKQELFLLFLIISFIQFLFESMLLRIAGILYFGFFYSYLFYFYYRNDDNDC